MSHAIDWLVEQGRDPVEALLIPPPADVAELLARDENERLDRELSRWLKQMPDELRQRLAELITAREQAAMKGQRP